jgi:hypothetical protein
MNSHTNLPVLRVTDKVLAYMGSRARVVTEYHTPGSIGLRTITYHWIDEAHPENGGWPAGSVTRKTIKGDGRYATGPKAFEIISPEELIA